MLPDRVSNPGPLTYESGAHVTCTTRTKHGQSYITKYRNVHFNIRSPNQPLDWDVLSKRSNKSTSHDNPENE